MTRRKTTPTFPIIVIIFLIVSSIPAFLVWFSINSKPVSDSQEKINFIVQRGETVEPIGKKLKSKGLIRSQAAFKIIAMKEGITNKIQAGSFTLSPSMNTTEIANSLTSGRQDFWITIYPGSRREEIAQQLEVTFKDVGLDFDKDIFLSLTAGKEGMLFPETHLIPLSISEETLVSIILNTFDSRVKQGLASEISSQSKTLNQILTLASLVEREARDESSRKIVAGILQNRLDINMALQVDATLQYAKGYNPIMKDWWAPPLATDKKIDSPYNTYLYPGLPPGPICSPSISSIKAVLNPTESNYLFYLTDNNGNMRYAKDLNTHNQNVNQYLR